MTINIYYGGRGLIGDPTVYVINKIQCVLEELNVDVKLYNLYDLKSSITPLHKTLKECDGVILASTVEWFGIGGYMQEFLDACWLYADKEKIEKLYMCPVVMSTTYGEREGKLSLINAWEILGGKCVDGLCGYISESSQLELSDDYTRLIEKTAENFYRTVNQKLNIFPASTKAVIEKVSRTNIVNLTPQESEQLSVYASDEQYVAKQKQDIKDLSSIFQEKLDDKKALADDNKYIKEIKKAFRKTPGVNAIIGINISDMGRTLIITVKNADMSVEYSTSEYTDVYLTMDTECMEEIVSGKETFQHGFLSGKYKKKGDFDILKKLDDIFVF